MWILKKLSLYFVNTGWFFFNTKHPVYKTFTVFSNLSGNIHKFIPRLCFTDPRVNGWPMMSSPIPTLAICLFYAYFSKVLGPKLMENRKPFNLKDLLIVYNLVQTIFSAWIFYEVLKIHPTVQLFITLIHLTFFFSVPDERLVGQLQFQMPTGRLFKQSHGT